MARAVDEIDIAAQDWVLRVGDPLFADWEAFSAWLAADPRHADRYHALEADSADLAVIIAPDEVAPIALPERRPTRRRWITGAVAASLAGLVGYGAIQTRADPYVVETTAGVTRAVQLADGSSITLNGATRLMLDHRNDRIATLEHGEVLFTIRHDPARPFRVSVGAHELVDVGTVFDVTRERDATWVGVAEGAVMFNPRADAVEIGPGRMLTARDGETTVSVGGVDTSSVGSWAAGRLDYAGAPLAQVASDLSRALGMRFTVAPGIAARPFRGTIALDRARRDPAVLAPLLDVRMSRTVQGWEIAPAS